MAVDPSNLTTVTIDRETYEVLLENYAENMLRRQTERHTARVLTNEQLKRIRERKETK